MLAGVGCGLKNFFHCKCIFLRIIFPRDSRNHKGLLGDLKSLFFLFVNMRDEAYLVRISCARKAYKKTANYLPKSILMASMIEQFLSVSLRCRFFS